MQIQGQRASRRDAFGIGLLKPDERSPGQGRHPTPADDAARLITCLYMKRDGAATSRRVILERRVGGRKALCLVTALFCGGCQSRNVQTYRGTSILAVETTGRLILVGACWTRLRHLPVDWHPLRIDSHSEITWDGRATPAADGPPPIPSGSRLELQRMQTRPCGSADHASISLSSLDRYGFMALKTHGVTAIRGTTSQDGQATKRAQDQESCPVDISNPEQVLISPRHKGPIRCYPIYAPHKQTRARLIESRCF